MLSSPNPNDLFEKLSSIVLKLTLFALLLLGCYKLVADHYHSVVAPQPGVRQEQPINSFSPRK